LRLQLFALKYVDDDDVVRKTRFFKRDTDLVSIRKSGNDRVAWPLALCRHSTVKSTWIEPRWAYGNTETITITTAFAHGTPPEVTGDTHGKPLPGNTVKIVDPLTGAIQPRGQPGEIAVKGPTLMLGYVGVPIDDTLDATGFFATGDGGNHTDHCLQWSQ
jgi:acyl-CoA synthetase (AMP-forming)/AMP-acid ligase II